MAQTQAEGEEYELDDDEKEELKNIDPKNREQMDAWNQKQRAKAVAKALRKNNTDNFKLSQLTSISGGGGRQQPERSSSQKKQKNKKKRKSH
jgi:hypothetical protein